MKCSCCRKAIKKPKKSSRGKKYKTCARCRKERSNNRQTTITIEKGVWRMDWTGHNLYHKIR